MNQSVSLGESSSRGFQILVNLKRRGRAEFICPADAISIHREYGTRKGRTPARNTEMRAEAGAAGRSSLFHIVANTFYFVKFRRVGP